LSFIIVVLVLRLSNVGDSLVDRRSGGPPGSALKPKMIASAARRSRKADLSWDLFEACAGVQVPIRPQEPEF
jgi:hypothetical protein